MTLLYRWYLENVDEQTAEHYLLAVHEAIQWMAGKPDLGRPRNFMAPELAHIRRIQVRKSSGRHLLFCRDGVTLRIERVIHGARGLPGRLLEQPGQS
jgi:plasmid stabilization system protein ParE